MTGVEIAAIGSAVASAAPYVAAGSAALGALGQIQSGNAQAAALRSNAEGQRRQAELERVVGEGEAARVQDAGRRRRAAAQNQLSGRGIDAQTGSAADVLDDLASGSALDAAIARWRASTAASARDAQAGIYDSQAKGVDEAKWWNAGSTLLTAGARMIGPPEPGPLKSLDLLDNTKRPLSIAPEPVTGRFGGPV